MAEFLPWTHERSILDTQRIQTNRGTREASAEKPVYARSHETSRPMITQHEPAKAKKKTHSLGLFEDRFTLGKSVSFGGSGTQRRGGAVQGSGREGGGIAADGED